MAGKPGWKMSESAKRRIAEANRGLTRSDEVKAKISATQRQNWKRMKELLEAAEAAA